MIELEDLTFEALNVHAARAPAIFILGAPRTGSTFIYQVMAAWCGLPFIANVTNDHFAATPILGLALQKALRDRWVPSFDSAFGKTIGPLQPSEGSEVMRHWFGGGHPSELVSNAALPGRESHMLQTLAAVQAMFGLPLLVKNAWNCFRISYLAKALPEAQFVWLRRDISASAKSDLEARYITKGSPYVWNSATPANLEELKRRPPVEQVVENQIAFNLAIRQSLEEIAARRWVHVWYENVCSNPSNELTRLGSKLGFEIEQENRIQVRSAAVRRRICDEEAQAIDRYVENQWDRTASFLHTDSKVLNESI
jgi:hypothetical protein